MPRLRVNTPLWLGRDSAARHVRFPTLTRELDVRRRGRRRRHHRRARWRWRFADAGIRVALVEAARIGRGSTAASTALLMQEPDADLAELAQRYGRRGRAASGSCSLARDARLRRDADAAAHRLRPRPRATRSTTRRRATTSPRCATSTGAEPAAGIDGAVAGRRGAAARDRLRRGGRRSGRAATPRSIRSRRASA